MARKRRTQFGFPAPSFPPLPIAVPGERPPAFSGTNSGNIQVQHEAVAAAPLGSTITLTNPTTGEVGPVKVTNRRKKKAIQWLQENPARADQPISGVANMGFSGGLIDNLRF